MIKNKQVLLTNTISKATGNIVSDMNGEKVMLCVSKGKYYNLGEVGGRIWDYIEKPIAVPEIINLLIAEYQVEKTDCQTNVITFLNSLLIEGLIEISEKITDK
jgi:tRNA splicing ligase